MIASFVRMAFTIYVRFDQYKAQNYRYFYSI